MSSSRARIFVQRKFSITFQYAEYPHTISEPGGIGAAPLLDVSYALDGSAEGVFNYSSALRRFNRGLRSFVDARTLERGNLYHPAADSLRKNAGIYFVPRLLQNVHHVDRDDDRNADLRQLRRKVQVPLEVRAVNDV